MSYTIYQRLEVQRQNEQTTSYVSVLKFNWSLYFKYGYTVSRSHSFLLEKNNYSYGGKN